MKKRLTLARLTLARYSILIALLLALTDVTAIRINEVLYDPLGNDNNREFVEVFNEEPINLTDWIISDSETNDTLMEIRYVEQNQPYYALIVEEGFNHTGMNASIYTAGATIGNNLNNEQDEIRLHDANGTLAANMSYNQTTNTSLEYYNGTYEESPLPTPGRENSREQKNETEDDTLLEINETTNETLSNETEPVFVLPVLNETANETENESVNTSPETTSPETDTATRDVDTAANRAPDTSVNIADPCTSPFSIRTAKDFIDNKEQFMYQLILDTNSSNATTAFEYWIEDLNGAVVRKKRTTYNTDPKSFTPSISEPEKAMLIKATATTGECTFHAEKMIVVRNRDSQQKSASQERSRQRQEKGQEQQKEKEQKRRVLYEIENIPETVILENGSAAISFTLHLTNDDEDHPFEVWSYVFRGPKSYSGGREENKQEFVLGSDQEMNVPLTNTVTNLTPGTYMLKIKIRKDNQASTTDLTEKIIFEELPELEKPVAPEIKTLISPQSATTPASRVVQRRSPLPAILGALVLGVTLVFIWVRG